MKLTVQATAILTLFKKIGYNYITTDESGNLFVWENIPKRSKCDNEWILGGEYEYLPDTAEILEIKALSGWDREPIEIDDLLK